MLGIALIDDHPLAINGIGAWLCATGRFSIEGAAGTLAEARSLMERLTPLPEIVILDVSLKEEDGLDFIPVLKEICAQRKTVMPGILVCSMHEDPFLVQRAIDSGAQGFVSKTAEVGEIIAAIDAILAGKTYTNVKSPMRDQTALTRRENEIASLVKQSLSTGQIAKRLGINIRTVEKHLEHIYSKTGVTSWKDLFEL